MNINDVLTKKWDARLNTFRTNKLIKLVNNCNGKKVLDVGCGTGTITKFFKGGVVGIDVSKEAIRQAKEKGISCFTYDLNEKIDFPENYFDVINCSQVIEHVFNTEVLVSEISRMLSIGGTLVINTPNMCSWINRIAVPLGFQPFYTDVANERIYGNRFKWTIHKQLDFTGHIRLMNFWSLKELLENHGLKVIKHIGGTAFKNKLFIMIDKILSIIYPRLSTDMIVIARKI
jgi:ubiquinone/menaquinone biosynthesis C-methylase UbiE